jgi:AraC-like DNA-binding protein
MIQLETFTTAGLTPRRKLEYWNDVACENFSTVADPTDPRTFSGYLVRSSVDEIRVAEVYSDSQIVRHTQAHVARMRQPMFFVHLQLDGDSVNRQDGREAVLLPHDFTLCDNTRPYEIAFRGSNRMIVIGIPDSTLRRHLPYPENVVAIPMSGSSGVSALLSGFLCDFWRQCREGADFRSASGVADALVVLLASAYANVPRAQSDGSSLATAHRVRILNFIETHLSDPDLTPTHIAQSCKMTTRYLHHLFSNEDETVARYILRRRLDECARTLTVKWQRGQTVTSIAFHHGFNSPTHFGRVFRERYGMTPREYRRRYSSET